MKDLDISNIESKPIVAKPKRRYPNRVVKSKYDKVVFELKMAQTALDNRNKDVDGWVKKINELISERDRLKNTRDRLREELELHKQSSMRKSLEVDRLKAENDELNQAYKMQDERHKSDMKEANGSIEVWRDRAIGNKEKLSTLRDQRTNAIFWAVGLGLVAFGFAVAVWIGWLIPVI